MATIALLVVGAVGTLALFSAVTSPLSSGSVAAATLAAPGAGSVSNPQTTSLTLSWADSSNLPTTGGSPDGYQVLRSTTSGGAYTAIATGTCAGTIAQTTTTTSCTDTGLTSTTTYFYVVQAVYDNWVSARNTQFSGSTQTAAHSVTFASAGEHTFTVPAGVLSVTYTIVGAGGGGGLGTGSGTGGDGALESGTITLSANASGVTLDVFVGNGGGDVTAGVGGSGCGATGPGGGGAAGAVNGSANHGGGGGGATCINVAGSPTNFIAIAGGGGGAGGSDGSNAGGNGGAGNGGCGTGGSCTSNPGTNSGSAGTGGAGVSPVAGAGQGGATSTTGSSFPYVRNDTGGAGGTGGNAPGGTGGTGTSSGNVGGTGGAAQGNGGSGGGGGGGIASGGGGAGAVNKDSGGGGGGGSGYSGGAQVSGVNYTVAVSSITQTGQASPPAGAGGAADNPGQPGYATFTGSGLTTGLVYSATGTPTTYTSAAAANVNYPAGTATNDLVLLVEVNTANTAGTTPGGWTLLTDQSATSPSAFRFDVWWKLAAGESSVSLTANATSTGATAWVVRYVRPGGYPPVPVAAGTAQGGTANASTTMTPGTNLTTSAENATVITIATVRAANTLSLSSAHSFTGENSTTSTPGSASIGLGVADQAVPSSGTAVASPTWSQTGTAAQWAWGTIAFA